MASPVTVSYSAGVPGTIGDIAVTTSTPLPVTSAAGAVSSTIAAPLNRQADAASVSVALSTEDVAAVNAITTAVTTVRAVGLVASAAFTPAATSHTANDANGAAAQFSFGAVSASNIMITAASILINGATVEVTAWRLYLYNVTPPSAYADDAAWDLGSGDQASFLGYIDLYSAIDLGSSQWNEVTGLSKQIKLAGTSVFGYLINTVTLTPAAVAHTVTLNAIQL